MKEVDTDAKNWFVTLDWTPELHDDLVQLLVRRSVKNVHELLDDEGNPRIEVCDKIIIHFLNEGRLLGGKKTILKKKRFLKPVDYYGE